jgi:hypothetical protein
MLVPNNHIESVRVGCNVDPLTFKSLRLRRRHLTGLAMRRTDELNQLRGLVFR